ncbi:MAG: FitA-like ribbon-helix-helix domain-containing protein [Terracidiphilus sp.]
MAVLTVRNLPEETHRALRIRAAAHGRSAEAEVRAILEDVVRPAERVRIGSALAALGARYGGIELDLRRDPSGTEKARFE